MYLEHTVGCNFITITNVSSFIITMDYTQIDLPIKRSQTDPETGKLSTPTFALKKKGEE